MSNWIDTEYLLFGDKDSLKEVENKIKSTKDGSYKKVAASFNYLDGYDIYGYIEALNLCEPEDSDCYLQVYTYTVRYDNSLIEFICDMYKLRYLFFSEHSANDFYITNDRERKYFSTRFIVLSTNGDCCSYATYEEASADLFERIGITYLGWDRNEAIADYNQKNPNNYVSFIEMKVV